MLVAKKIQQLNCLLSPQREIAIIYHQNTYTIKVHIFRTNMSDLAWAVKNGDLDQVKEMVEGKVSDTPLFSEVTCNVHDSRVSMSTLI